MKLLLDENISHRLIPSLIELFPGSQHVRDIGLKRSPDTDIWRYSIEHDFIIVSKDADFHQRSILFGFPPKVVGIFAGNCPSEVVRDLILKNHSRI